MKKKKINLAILVYTFLIPTSIIYTAITLREVYMLLFFNLFALSLVNIYYKSDIKKILFDSIIILFTLFMNVGQITAITIYLLVDMVDELVPMVLLEFH